MKKQKLYIMLYRIIKSYLKVKILGKPAPISTLVSITNACPKGCCYCDSWKYPPMYTPTEKILRLLKELDEAGVSRITFHGGDPLMHPDIDRIVKETSQYNFFTTISVRESLIIEHLDDLKYVDLVFVSFDGKEKAHDAHKGKGSFKELIPAFQALKENNIPFQTTTCVTKNNKDDLGFIVETANEYNFQAHFQPLQFPPFKKIEQSALNDPEKNPMSPLLLTKEEYFQIGKKLLEMKNRGGSIATSKKIIQMIFTDWPDPALTYLPYRLDKSIKCWSGSLYNNVAATGELFACGYYNPSYLPGNAPNVFEEGVANAFKKKIVDGACQTCMLPCYMELNAMFSLNIKTVLNWIPKVLKRK